MITNINYYYLIQDGKKLSVTKERYTVLRCKFKNRQESINKIVDEPNALIVEYSIKIS